MNKLNSITNILGICLVVLVTTSCDPGTDYKKSIVNQSSKSITLLVNKNYNAKVDTIVINAGSSYVVEVSRNLGSPNQNYSDCNRGFPLSYINPIDSSKVNLSNSPDWIYEQIKKGKGYIVTCSYVIKDDSFIQ